MVNLVGLWRMIQDFGKASDYEYSLKWCQDAMLAAGLNPECDDDCNAFIAHNSNNPHVMRVLEYQNQ